jgi:hypothetical protein
MGEAESIYFAAKLGGYFATDDNAAYDFAERYLGSGRVIDTVHILRDAVSLGEMTSSVAAGHATRIRESGRHLRRLHPSTLSAAHF